jgi:hypothetical protein
MGWIITLLNKIEGVESEPVSFTFAPHISGADVPGIGIQLKPDECYVELYLETLRISRARRFATRFHGLVYSFVTLSREGDVASKLSAVSKPEKLAELDMSSLNKVITVSKKLMGAIPYRGGPISLELGLFSVKSGNLLSPVIDYVTKVSKVAGISYVDAVKPFVPLISEGMDLIAGQTQDALLEIGLDTDLIWSQSGLGAIVALPRNAVNPKKITFSDGVLLYDGQELNCAYAVFSLRHSKTKPDYGEIPELKKKYAEFIAALNLDKKKEARDALMAFRLAVISSPDLITQDAERLAIKAKKIYEAAFPEGGFASLGFQRSRDALTDLDLYDNMK